jgi:hypothetical protein
VNGFVLSSNWSGYAFQGRVKEVRGTFTVPYARGTGFSAQWVGVDGYANSDLIQAGVTEDCLQGSCTYQAWWEILPSVSVPIPWLVINPGDQVTVGVRDEGGGQWSVGIMDDATGQVFQQFFNYRGPAASAEWIVEAPEVFWQIAPIAPSTTVTWSDLHLLGRTNALQDIWLVQDGRVQEVPESVANARALMANGFTDQYVGP